MKRRTRHKQHAAKARRRRAGRRTRRITVTYSTITPESAESGDFDDTGWVDEEGIEIALDKWDRADGLTIAKKAAKILRDAGAIEPSSSAPGRGTWYSTGFTTSDYQTGEEREESYHLKGFSPTEEREIYKLVTAR